MSETNTPMFSIITPVYNHVEYVGEAIASVAEQTYENWELWIVDDGSTDGSAEVIDAWAAKDPRIHALHQTNAGPAVARNAALARCRGEWLAFLDSDDLYFPTTLAMFASYIAACPEASFFYGYRHRLADDGKITQLDGEFQDHVTGAPELFGRMYLSHLCVCYRRELMEKIGGYDEKLRSVEDYDLYLRMSAHTTFHPLGKPTGLRRRHETNISRQTGHNRMVQAAVLRRFVERFGGSEVLNHDLIDRRLGKIYYAAGRQYFKQGCFAQALDALKTAAAYRPTRKGKLLALAARLLKPFGRRDEKEIPSL